MTPNEHLSTAPRSAGSRSLPLQKPRRRRPAHFPTVTIGFQSIIIFLTVCTRQRKPLLTNDGAAQLIIESWQAGSFWRVGRYVIMPDHIHLFCAPKYPPSAPAQGVDRVLEKSSDTSLAVSCSGPDLATGVLGSAVAPIRVLLREVALRSEQSSSPWLCAPRRRLALSGRTQCLGVARLVNMEGGPLRCLTERPRIPRPCRARGARPSICRYAPLPKISKKMY